MNNLKLKTLTIFSDHWIEMLLLPAAVVCIFVEAVLCQSIILFMMDVVTSIARRRRSLLNGAP